MTSIETANFRDIRVRVFADSERANDMPKLASRPDLHYFFLIHRKPFSPMRVWWLAGTIISTTEPGLAIWPASLLARPAIAFQQSNDVTGIFLFHVSQEVV
jgi:hypothetical protein